MVYGYSLLCLSQVDSRWNCVLVHLKEVLEQLVGIDLAVRSLEVTHLNERSSLVIQW